MLSHPLLLRPWPASIWSTHILGSHQPHIWFHIALYGIVLGEEFQDDEIPNLASFNTTLDLRAYGLCAHLILAPQNALYAIVQCASI